MRVLLSSVLLALTWFALVNIVMSATTWVVARLVMRRSTADAGLLFTIRMVPAFASIFFVSAVFLPSHVRFEQPDVDESFGVVLACCAMIALVMLLRSAARAIRVGWADHQFGRVARLGAGQ